MKSGVMRVFLGLSSYKSDWQENQRGNLWLREELKLSSNIFVELNVFVAETENDIVLE